MAGGARSLRTSCKARSAKSEHCSRTYVYEPSMRRWPEAARWAEQMRALAPTSLVAKIHSGYIAFQWKGDPRLLNSMLDEIPAAVDPDGSVTAARWELAMLQR